MKNLAKAILNVMNDVKGIEKSMKVGSGNMTYQGVPDQQVKKIIGESMFKHGLTILPIEIEPRAKVSRWEEKTNYGLKQKQSVFTEVIAKYLLLHESGESQVLSGYGHGVDSQDKGAGKATTYALKYTLLYTFLVPTGKIDDSDTTHSNEYKEPIHGVKIPSEKLKECKTQSELKNTFLSLTRTEQTATETLKNELKLSLNGSN